MVDPFWYAEQHNQMRVHFIIPIVEAQWDHQNENPQEHPIKELFTREQSDDWKAFLPGRKDRFDDNLQGRLISGVDQFILGLILNGI